MTTSSRFSAASRQFRLPSSLRMGRIAPRALSSCLLLSLLLGCSGQQSPLEPGGGNDVGNDAEPDPNAADPGRDAAGSGAGLGSSGVCGFEQPVAAGAAGADGLVDIAPSDPNIFYMGRVDCRLEAPRFAFPASSVRLRFVSDALDLRLRDGGGGTAQSTNYYDVSIDGAEPTRLEAIPGEQVYELARDLSAGEHTAEIVKRSESNGGSGLGELLGFRLRKGSTLLPVTPRALRLELVGDSITCGYGNEVSTTSPQDFPFTTLGSNANRAYGAVVARELNAEYVAVAVSGRGAYRNYAGGPGATMPVVYERTLPDSAAGPAWDFARYSPDVVVVNLGTNDFSPPGPDHDAFKSAYSAFLSTIRGHHPSALLLAVVGPMLSDGYPAGVMAWTTIQSDVSAVVAELAAAGDARVHYLALTPQSAPYGEDWHPTNATHEQMAATVTAEIRRLLSARD